MTNGAFFKGLLVEKLCGHDLEIWAEEREKAEGKIIGRCPSLTGLLEQVTGERGRRFMTKKIIYTDEPMKTGKIVKDFLPGPEGLSFRKERVLTLRLDEPTIAELKEVADNKGLGVSTLVRMWVRERLAGNATM